MEKGLALRSFGKQGHGMGHHLLVGSGLRKWKRNRQDTEKDAYSRICCRHFNARKSVYSKLSQIYFYKFKPLGYLPR